MLLGNSMQKDNTVVKYADVEAHAIQGKYCYRWAN